MVTKPIKASFIVNYNVCVMEVSQIERIVYC